MNKKRVVLGRGLSALLGDTVNPASEKQDAPHATELALEKVEFNPFQPRKSFDREALEGLATSIKTHGLIQPITVKHLSKDRYQLIAGERRVHAAKIAGLKTVPAHIRAANDQQLLEMALIENIQRENLNPIEVALSYQRLISDIKLKQEELGNRVGKKRSTVTNYLRLLKLPPTIQAALRDHKISMGHARPLIVVEHIDKQLYIFEKILSDKLSVRQTEALTRRITDLSNQTSPSNSITKKPHNRSKENHDAIQLQSQLSSYFGTKVSVKIKGKAGEIKIPFTSISDLNRILDIINM